MFDNAIIMAGGVGSRLWPASTPQLPKQFFDPGIGMPLLQATVERVAAAFDRHPAGGGAIVIVTHHRQLEQSIALCAQLPRQLRSRIVLIGEPAGRNTAAAIALALAWLQRRPDATARRPGSGGSPVEAQPSGTSAVFPADQLIAPPEHFAADMAAGDAVARAGWLVTFGIRPTRPETGYGYIERGAPITDAATDVSSIDARRANFHEKPDADRAGQFLATGNHLWNTGIFLFPDRLMLQELATWLPETTFAHLPPTISRPDSLTVVEPDGALEQRYRTLPDISIDYAIMERSARVAVVAAHFDWSDAGSWDELATLAEQGKLPHTDRAISIDSAGNFVSADCPVALCGVNDLIVVMSGGRLLICRRGASQLVRKAAEADAQ